ncbi:MAG: hypothetical protein IPI29_12430 [Ignavibacteria bacterium]|nr:hypothetical protein [Ignavibacteria bacterium]
MNELKRTSTPFDAVICLNGSIPTVDVFELVMDRPLIAADGAAQISLSCRYRPGVHCWRS